MLETISESTEAKQSRNHEAEQSINEHSVSHGIASLTLSQVQTIAANRPAAIKRAADKSAEHDGANGQENDELAAEPRPKGKQTQNQKI